MQIPGFVRLLQQNKGRPAVQSMICSRRFDGLPTSVRQLAPIPLNLRHRRKGGLGVAFPSSSHILRPLTNPFSHVTNQFADRHHAGCTLNVFCTENVLIMNQTHPLDRAMCLQCVSSHCPQLAKPVLRLSARHCVVTTDPGWSTLLLPCICS